jgi:hypothetical protein
MIYLWIFDEVDTLSCFTSLGRYKPWPKMHSTGINYINSSIYDILNALHECGYVEHKKHGQATQLTFIGMKYAYLTYTGAMVPRCWILKNGKVRLFFKKVDKNKK